MISMKSIFCTKRSRCVSFQTMILHLGTSNQKWKNSPSVENFATFSCWSSSTCSTSQRSSWAFGFSSTGTSARGWSSTPPSSAPTCCVRRRRFPCWTRCPEFWFRSTCCRFREPPSRSGSVSKLFRPRRRHERSYVTSTDTWTTICVGSTSAKCSPMTFSTFRWPLAPVLTS